MTFNNRYLAETVTGKPEFGIKAGQFSNGRRLKNTDREEVIEKKKKKIKKVKITLKKSKTYFAKNKNSQTKSRSSEIPIGTYFIVRHFDPKM